MASTCCSEDVSTEPCLSFTVLIQGRCRLLSRSFSFKFGSLTLALMSALRWDWYQHSSNQLSTHQACLHEVFQRRVGIQVKDETRVAGDSCLHEHHAVHLIIRLPWRLFCDYFRKNTAPADMLARSTKNLNSWIETQLFAIRGGAFIRHCTDNDKDHLTW